MASLEGKPNSPKNAEEEHVPSPNRSLQDAIVEALLSKVQNKKKKG